MGSPETVVEQIQKIEEAGIDHLLLHFTPTFAEVERFGDQVMPLLQDSKDSGEGKFLLAQNQEQREGTGACNDLQGIVAEVQSNSTCPSAIISSRMSTTSGSYLVPLWISISRSTSSLAFADRYGR